MLRKCHYELVTVLSLNKLCSNEKVSMLWVCHFFGFRAPVISMKEDPCSSIFVIGRLLPLKMTSVTQVRSIDDIIRLHNLWSEKTLSRIFIDVAHFKCFISSTCPFYLVSLGCIITKGDKCFVNVINSRSRYFY